MQPKAPKLENLYCAFNILHATYEQTDLHKQEQLTGSRLKIKVIFLTAIKANQQQK